MARSSGGGSRSGGSRGGSRSRSRSRSGGGSRSGGKSYIHSNTPRLGCDKYRYTDRHGQTRYVWCNYNPAEKQKTNLFYRAFLLIFYIPFYFAVILMIASSVFIPNPISKEENPHSQILIGDNLGVIEDKEALTQSLTAFYEKTGVTPAVITVPTEMWKDYYDSLETFALELYYMNFDDECHWLIVYSEPITEEFNDWEWEGIIGDDTVSAISDEFCNLLTNTMQKNLYKGNGVGKAIGDTFTTSAVQYKVQINFAIIPMALFMFVFVTFHACCMLGVFGGRKVYKDAVKVEDENVVPTTPTTSQTPTIIKCAYCDGTYSSDITLACPHCNAPVTVQSVQSVSNNDAPEGIYVKESNSDMI